MAWYQFRVLKGSASLAYETFVGGERVLKATQLMEANCPFSFTGGN